MKIFVFRETQHNDLTPEFAENNGMGGTDHVTLSFVEYLSEYCEVKLCCNTIERKYWNKVEFIPFQSHIQVCNEISNFQPNKVIVVGNPKLIYDKNYKFQDKTIFWQHNHPDEMRQFNIKVMLLDKGINIVLPSPEAAEYCKKHYGNYENIFGIYNGIRDEFFVKYNIERRNNVVAYVGCLTKQKGLWEFLAAAKQLPQYKFEIYGDFDLYGENTTDEQFKKDCKEIIERNSNISLMGKFSSKELTKHIQTVNLVIANPNVGNKETCCLSALEAMVTGTPVIVGGNAIIDPIVSRGGIPYKGNLADEIVKLISNREKMNNLGQTGLEFARTLNWNTIIKQWVEFLERNLNNV